MSLLRLRVRSFVVRRGGPQDLRVRFACHNKRSGPFKGMTQQKLRVKLSHAHSEGRLHNSCRRREGDGVVLVLAPLCVS